MLFRLRPKLIFPFPPKKGQIKVILDLLAWNIDLMWEVWWLSWERSDSDMYFGNIPGLLCTGIVIEARSPAISLELCEVVRLVLNIAVEANKRDLKDYKE